MQRDHAIFSEGKLFSFFESVDDETNEAQFRKSSFSKDSDN